MRKKTEVTIYKVDTGTLVANKVAFVNDGCTYFFNAQHKFIQLKTLERVYFDFICEKMNSRNKIELNPVFRKQFLSFCKEVFNKEGVRTERSLLNTELKLINLALIFKDPINKKLNYVNPKYVFKGTLTERGKLLNSLARLSISHEYIAKVLLNVEFDSLKADERLLNIHIDKTDNNI